MIWLQLCFFVDTGRSWSPLWWYQSSRSAWSRHRKCSLQFAIITFAWYKLCFLCKAPEEHFFNKDGVWTYHLIQGRKQKMATTPYEGLFESKAMHTVQNITLQDNAKANFVNVQSWCFGCHVSDSSKFIKQSKNHHQTVISFKVITIQKETHLQLQIT